MPGWKTNLTDVTSVDQLPENAKKYLARLAELLNAKIGIISVGPRRDQTFEVK
jgi:adenylosuccinate synthase